MGRRFRASDPTANAAIGNVTRQGKGRAPRLRNRRRIVAEFPHIFRGLDEGQKVSVTLVAAELAGHDAWAITEEHLAAAKIRVLREARC